MCGEKHHTKFHEDEATSTPSAFSASATEAKVMYTSMSSDNSSIKKKKNAFIEKPWSQFKDLMVILLRQELFWILLQKIRLLLSILHKY